MKKCNNITFYYHPDFTSTTFYLPSASRIMKNDCCLLEYTIDISTPCLFTAYISRQRSEYEIILGPDINIIFIRCKYKLMLNNDEEYYNVSFKEILAYPEKYNITRRIKMCECICVPNFSS